MGHPRRLAPDPHIPSGARTVACITLYLVAALAGFPPHTCVLRCDIESGLVAALDGDRGKAMLSDGAWFNVVRTESGWTWVAEQLPEQCRKDG